MTTSDTIVVGSHQWSVVDRTRSATLLIGGIGLLVASNVTHERWLTWLGITLLAAFVYVASTAGHVVHIARERIETVGAFGVRGIDAIDVTEVSVADDAFGSVIVIVRGRTGRPISVPMRIIEQHPDGVVALHQFLDRAIGSGTLDPSKVSLRNELAFY